MKKYLLILLLFIPLKAFCQTSEKQYYLYNIVSFEGDACWTSRSSARDTAKQITALEDNSNRQIESIKELTRIQIETTSLILEKELWDARYMNQQINRRSFDNTDNHFAMMGMPYNEVIARIQDRNEKKRELSYHQEFLAKQANYLSSCLQRLEKIKNDLAIS